MKKKQIYILIIIIVIISLSTYSLSQLTGKTIGGETRTIQLTKQNLPLYLNQHEMITGISKAATIGFQFYDFSNGQKVWQEKYLLKNKKVEQKDFTDENPDIIIAMHSKYFQMFGDICNAIKTANNNGDLSYELKISKAKLLWRYKSMVKYKNCF